MEELEKNRLGGNTDTGLLKLLALVLMIIDHVGALLTKDARFLSFSFPWITEMRVLGRIALPLYAWCLVVGCTRTRSMGKYALRLLGLAVLSQPLYMLGLNHDWWELNILFLLCLGVLAIWGIRAKVWFSHLWGPALCFAAACLLDIDYGWKGLLFVIFLYLVRENRGGIFALILGYSLFWGMSTASVKSLFGVPLVFLNWGDLGIALSSFFHLQTMAWLSLPLILCRTHTRLRLPKWLGYGFYPLHLAGLILLRLLWGVPWDTLAAKLAVF